MFSTHPSRARNNQSSTFSLVHQWCPRFSCKYSQLKSTKTRTNRNSEPKTSRGYTIPEKGRMTKNCENTLLTSKLFWLSKFRFFGFIHSNLPSEWIVRFKFAFDCGWGLASRAQYPETNSPDWYSYISLEISWESLLKDQSIFSLVIILLILITYLLTMYRYC